jgi:hypothetical protein
VPVPPSATEPCSTAAGHAHQVRGARRYDLVAAGQR